MTTVSFPLTLTGSYIDGSVCSAADYRADFEKIRDAINHMHERFSTLVFTGHDITYQDVASVYMPASGSDNVGFPTTVTGSGWTGAERKILNVMKIPSWMQGVRVRGLELCNFSRLPAADSATWIDDPIYYWPNATYPLRYGIAHGTLASMDPNNWTATDIANIELDTNAKVRGPYQYEDTLELNINPVFADGTGYHTASANVVVPPGDYMALYATGKAEFRDANSAVGGLLTCYDLNWHFAVNALCDAMVPVL